MKKLLALIPILALLSGCAWVRSTTYDATSGKATSTVRVLTFLDSHTELAKLSNRAAPSGSNQWPAGTVIGGLDQSSSSTNLNNIFEAVARGAAAGAKP